MPEQCGAFWRMETVEKEKPLCLAKGIGALWSDTEVSPGRTFGGRGGRGPAARIAAQLRALRFGQSAGARVRAQVVSSEFVRALDVVFQVGGELVGAKSGAFLDANAVREEQRQVGGDDKMPGGLTFFQDIKTVGARVFLLLESQVAKFHRVPFSERPARARRRLEVPFYPATRGSMVVLFSSKP